MIRVAGKSEQHCELMSGGADSIAAELRIRACLGDDEAEQMARRVVDHLAKVYGGRCFYFAQDIREQRRKLRLGGAPLDPVSLGSKRPHHMLCELSETLVQTLAEHGAASGERAKQIAEAAMDALANYWSGREMYIARNWRGGKVDRDQEIFARFNSGNAHALATEYGLSYVRIYQIVARIRKDMQQRAKAQPAAPVQLGQKNGPRWQATEVTS